MMRNNDYDHEGMVITMRQVTDDLHQITNKLGWTTNELKDERGGGYHTDHLDETMDNAVKQLHKIADRLERLREYTQYPSIDVLERMNARKGAA